MFQVVFLDTPGVVNLEEKKRFKLEQSLVVDPEASCIEADLILGKLGILYINKGFLYTAS